MIGCDLHESPTMKNEYIINTYGQLYMDKAKTERWVRDKKKEECNW